MTSQEKNYLLELIHAAFENALSQDIRPPIDLGKFGLILRALDRNFSHEKYGHEKLLYLLREFQEILYIKKDVEVVPPRYFVSIRRGLAAPVRAQSQLLTEPFLGFLNATLVDSTLIDHYLRCLAENTARIHRRMDEFDRNSAEIKNELEQSRVNETRLHSQAQEIQTELKNIHRRSNEFERNFIDIQKELEQSRVNEARLNSQSYEFQNELKRLVRNNR